MWIDGSAESLTQHVAGQPLLQQTQGRKIKQFQSNTWFAKFKHSSELSLTAFLFGSSSIFTCSETGNLASFYTDWPALDTF